MALTAYFYFNHWNVYYGYFLVTITWYFYLIHVNELEKPGKLYEYKTFMSYFKPESIKLFFADFKQDDIKKYISYLSLFFIIWWIFIILILGWDEWELLIHYYWYLVILSQSKLPYDHPWRTLGVYRGLAYLVLFLSMHWYFYHLYHWWY